MRTWKQAVGAHRQAWRLLRGPLSWWFLPAGLVTLFLAGLGWWGIAQLSEKAAELIGSQVSDDPMSPWLHSLTEWLVWLMLLVLKLKLTKYVVLVVMGPLFAAVSEAAEAHMTGVETPFSMTRWIKDAVRGLRSAALLAAFEWSLAAGLWALGLMVPVLSPVTLPLAWLLGAWAYGASVMDCVWEREGKGARAGWWASVKRADVALSVGVPFALWMSVPVLAWTVGPLMGGLGATATACVALRQPRSASDQPATT